MLYVEGYRRYEYHYVKTLLERESNRIKGNKSIDLKVLLLDADPDFARAGPLGHQRVPDQVRAEQLRRGHPGRRRPRVQRRPKMTEHLKDLADFVRERGGGLLVIAGERFAPPPTRTRR